MVVTKQWVNQLVLVHPRQLAPTGVFVTDRRLVVWLPRDWLLMADTQQAQIFHINFLTLSVLVKWAEAVEIVFCQDYGLWSITSCW